MQWDYEWQRRYEYPMNKISIAALFLFSTICALCAEEQPHVDRDPTPVTAETVSPVRFSTAQDILYKLDLVPETMHEEIELIGSYVDALDGLRHLKDKSKEQVAQYEDMSSMANLSALQKQSQLTEKMYKEDPDEGGKSREGDLKRIAFLNAKIDRYIKVRILLDHSTKIEDK